MIKLVQTVSFFTFSDSFSDQYKNNFTYEGKRALFDYLELLEEDSGIQIELDTVSFACEYTEFDSFADLQAQYTQIKSMEDLEDHTTVIKIEGTERFIIQDF